MGNATSRAPIMSGMRKISKHGRRNRHQEKEDHDDAVDGEEFVVGIGGDEVSHRCEQLKPHQRGCDAANRKEEERREQVENGNALVILGQQP